MMKVITYLMKVITYMIKIITYMMKVITYLMKVIAYAQSRKIGNQIILKVVGASKEESQDRLRSPMPEGEEP
jgi:hypothetical protein